VQHNVLLALAGLLVLFGGILPMLRRLEQMRLALPVPNARRAILAANVNVALGPRPRRPAWSIGGRREPATGPAAHPDVFRIEPDTVRVLAANDPARTAQVIKGWISNDRSSNSDA
jgi:flagellar biosynthesis/type III secretory pathway M-ring protein FliF/YscJ